LTTTKLHRFFRYQDRQSAVLTQTFKPIEANQAKLAARRGSNEQGLSSYNRRIRKDIFRPVRKGFLLDMAKKFKKYEIAEIVVLGEGSQQ